MESKKDEKKFSIIIKMKVKDKELTLSMDDARKLFETLSEIFQKEKEYISYPVYPVSPFRPIYPFNPYNPWDTYTVCLNDSTLE